MFYNEGDNNFVDFMEMCLKYDPNERMTAETGLQHPWIKNNQIPSL